MKSVWRDARKVAEMEVYDKLRLDGEAEVTKKSIEAAEGEKAKIPELASSVIAQSLYGNDVFYSLEA